jgi:hypothetical protein
MFLAANSYISGMSTPVVTNVTRATHPLSGLGNNRLPSIRRVGLRNLALRIKCI